MKLMFKIVLIVLMAFPLVGIAQQQINPFVEKVKFPNGIERCSTDRMDSIRRAENPNLPSREEFEVWIKEQIKASKNNKSLKATVLTIPVVVHVVHNGDALGANENITDAQVISQIDVLNQDYRRMLGTNGYNTDTVGADVEIEFCLAQFDTAGNATTGIDRVQMSQATWSTTDVNSILKPATVWDQTKYFNIWTVDFGASGILAFTQYPDNSGLSGLSTANGAAITDGLTIGYSYFGSVELYPAGNYTTPYDKGRTATHEVGHWLGLLHTWGDGVCGAGDDFCGDTPGTDVGHYGCTPSAGCFTPDMIENYMEYTDDACMNIFTLDQKDRMRAVMSASPRRVELLNSTVCGVLGTTDAGLIGVIDPIGNVCSSNFIFPTVMLKNFGTDTLFSVDVNYYLDGGTPIVFNWNGVLAPDSVEWVFLPNMTPSLGGHVFTAFTSNPNSIADANTGNDFSTSSFNMLGVGVIPGAGVPDTVETCPNQITYITAFGGVDYYWTGDSIVDPYSPTIEVVVDTTTIYYVDITNGDCFQYDSTVVMINTQGCEGGVINNNVFSPNDDGVNDGFVMDIPQLLTNENTVTIYNRWGDVLIEFVNYNNNDVIWDGKDRSGNDLVSGTYFYVIEIPEVNYSNSGWIQLIR